jgi:transcriptional regulator with XRE-family HTH domain
MLTTEKRFLKKKLGKLKRHERLIIHRKRRGLTQNQEAEEWSATLYMYRQWEKGLVPKRLIIERVSRIGIFEICFLLRRRRKLTIQQIADFIDVSKAWVSEMERGTVYIGDLVEYWMHQYDK